MIQVYTCLFKQYNLLFNLKIHQTQAISRPWYIHNHHNPAALEGIPPNFECIIGIHYPKCSTNQMLNAALSHWVCLTSYALSHFLSENNIDRFVCLLCIWKIIKPTAHAVYPDTRHKGVKSIGRINIPRQTTISEGHHKSGQCMEQCSRSPKPAGWISGPESGGLEMSTWKHT